jgi:hypothetical protein
MLIASLFVSSCQKEVIEIPERVPTPIDLETVGSIAGLVRFLGETPLVTPIAMGGFPGCLINHSEPYQDSSVLVENGRLRNVFVYIREGLDERVFSIPTDPVVFDQKGCVYRPHVFGVQRFQPIMVTNSDSLLHNVHSLPVNQAGFNFGQPVAGVKNMVQFGESEVMVPVKCDVHGWMRAYIGVVDHPYFAVTPADGSFRLENVPPGSYTLEAWHEMFGVQRAKVIVRDNDDVIVNFEFSL